MDAADPIIPVRLVLGDDTPGLAKAGTRRVKSCIAIRVSLLVRWVGSISAVYAVIEGLDAE